MWPDAPFFLLTYHRIIPILKLMKHQFVHLVFLLVPCLLAAQTADLVILPGDVRIEQRADGGFHLYIRKKPGLASVLLTESTRDPAMREDNFAYRSVEWNAVNGDELRLLDGAPIPREQGIYSLIDSTTGYHGELGEAFHIYIPYLIYYGYQDTRHGEVYVVDGTYFNIRAFSLPYADYRGSFHDNPFMLSVTQRPLPGPPEGNFMKETIAAFQSIGAAGNGRTVYSTGNDIVQAVRELLLPERGKTLDLVLCLDTTGSMKPKIDALRRDLAAALSELLPGFPNFRLGMVLFRDYGEAYIARRVPFISDIGQVQKALDAVQIQGGKDIPEAVHEALYEGAIGFPWEAQARVMILAGDAPPHLRQRGSVSWDMVESAVRERGIKVHAIILPQ